MQRKGKCYILGNVLVIGQWTHEEPGYLKLEYFGHLKKLPFWDNTRFYSFINELLDNSTGQGLTNESLEKHLTILKSDRLKSPMDVSPGMYRLGRYQITVTNKDKIEWQSSLVLNKAVGGRCIIESDILFIGTEEYEIRDQNRRKFLNQLNSLPKWDQSVAWCRSMVLKTCE